MKQSIGVLGAGQLSQMICEVAAKLQVETWVYAQHADESACPLANHVVIGETDNQSRLEDFLSKPTHILFESEFFNIDTIRKASQKNNFYPSLDLMEKLRDKSEQKALCVKAGLPTSEFKIYSGSEELEIWIRNCHTQMGSLVLKWARLGYDGKGVFFLKNDLSNLPQALQFCNQSLEKGIRVYAEKKVEFVQELAIIGCQNSKKEFAHYPVVFSEQQDGICRKVWGPMPDMPEAIAVARKFAEETRIVGCFAIEFFLTADHKILINEIAPRVHNSGHYTQDAYAVSQFENHLRACLGMPLDTTPKYSHFGMLNILGPKKEGRVMLFPESHPQVFMHWYHKRESKFNRKMGHYNLIARSESELKKLFETAEASIEKWYKNPKAFNKK